MTGSSLFLLIGAVAALWYGSQLVHQSVSHLRSVVKMLSTSALVVAGAIAGAPVLILLGLAFGVLGDAFLSRDMKSGFLPGLAAFLIGHLCYLAWGAMALSRAMPPIVLDGMAALDIGVFLVVVGYVLFKLWPHLAAMKLPVCVYTAASAMLGIVALLAMDVEGAALFAFGVGAFITSDVILAFQIFVMSPEKRWYRMSATALWALYWSGQAAIVTGAYIWVQLPA